MVAGLKQKGISDVRVLRAMGAVPRHLFVPSGFEFQAYHDKALPIGHNQTISHPFTVARMTELLQIKEGQRILEIGTGSGYQCAVLCQLGAYVFSVEIHAKLAQNAEKLLQKLGCRAAIRAGDGSIGWPEFAPYDGILVTAGAPLTPDILLEQLKPGGRLIIPVGSGSRHRLTLFRKGREGIKKEELDRVSFVPLTGKNVLNNKKKND